MFTFGYLVESEKRTVNGKVRRVQKKTPISYLLAPVGDNAGGGNGGSQSGDGSQSGGGTNSGGSGGDDDERPGAGG